MGGTKNVLIVLNLVILSSVVSYDRVGWPIIVLFHVKVVRSFIVASDERPPNVLFEYRWVIYSYVR